MIQLYIRLKSFSDVGLAGTEALVDDGVDATFTGFDKLLHDDISLSLPKKKRLEKENIIENLYYFCFRTKNYNSAHY